MRPLYLAVLAGLLGLLAPGAHAQRSDTLGAGTASLVGWQHDLDLALMDQRHAYGGLFYDRGLFRRYTYPMDHEFVIDLLTYGFTLEDDARWYAAPTAFRLSSGSINTSRFASRSHFRARVPLAARQEMYIDGVLREDRGVVRAFTRVGYGLALGQRHQIGLHQTFASYKPDLDLSVFYRYEHPLLGALRLESTFLDVANNFIFDHLEVEAVQEDTLRSYENPPLLLTLAATTANHRGWRGEAATGWMPTVTARVRSSSQPDLKYDWTQHARYAGILIEYGRPFITTGAIYRYQHTSVTRAAPAGSAYTSDYTSRQTTSSATAYALARHGSWTGKLWLTLEHFDDEQHGDDYDLAALPTDLNYRETQLLVRVECSHRPIRRGVRAGLTFLQLGALERQNYDEIAPSFKYFHNRRNSRLIAHVGYQARPDTYVVVGAAYDIDGDAFYDGPPRRYDGGFGRIVVTW